MPPDRVYSYPPKAAAQPTPRPRFRFIRRFSSIGGKKIKGSTESPTQPDDNYTTKEPQTWEEHWEQGEYPFVVLEGNRAACAICLMDFEEPKRIGPTSSGPDLIAETTVQDQTEKSAPDDEPIAAEAQAIAEEGRNDSLKLENAGEGAQPLRLLTCGHVFHVGLTVHVFPSNWSYSRFLFRRNHV